MRHLRSTNNRTVNTFYDIHTHAFDLSHPSLSVFLQREDIIDSVVDSVWTLSLRWLLPFASLMPKSSLKKLIHKKAATFQNQLTNTLAFFEIPMEYQFLVMDYFLKNGATAGDEAYTKIVLCPLVIDFGHKNITSSAYYNLTPKTPVAGQVSDLFYAIRTYCRFDVEIANNKMRLKAIDNWAARKHEKRFEIYPFMGIDTRNYTKKAIITLLDKYFNSFSRHETPTERHQRLFDKMGLLDSNLYRDRQTLTDADREILRQQNLAPDYQYAFAGIKVYPQLGFDPFPDDTDERDKVNYLYQYCIDRRIPITTHCSDSGYKPEDNNHLTTPMPAGKWANVLNAFPELTLNFAHFGSQGNGKKQWRDAIIELTNKYDRVYTDISCKSATYYKELADLLTANPRLQERVLYGSDFSINLLVSDTNCYSENIDAFLHAPLKPSDKISLCERNPERFLFGGNVIRDMVGHANDTNNANLRK